MIISADFWMKCWFIHSQHVDFVEFNLINCLKALSTTTQILNNKCIHILFWTHVQLQNLNTTITWTFLCLDYNFHWYLELSQTFLWSLQFNSIHSKSEKVCGVCFSVTKNLRKKCVNLNIKISPQKYVNQ